LWGALRTLRPLRPPGLALRAPLPREVATLADSLRSGQWNGTAPHNGERRAPAESVTAAQSNGEPLNRAMSGARLRAERRLGGEGPAKLEPGGRTVPLNT